VISISGFCIELPFVKYPFPLSREILCDQGTQSSNGNSHTYSNTLYALDLATPSNTNPAEILAGLDGHVISFANCIEHNSQCGAGFGNHIKILNHDGTMAFYAHLEKIFVETGQFVKSGQVIGTEGATGWTGKNNRHLHISLHSDWKINGFEYYEKYLGSLPKSIPFKMNICQNKYSNCDGHPTDIRQLKCKRVTGQNERVSSF